MKQGKDTGKLTTIQLGGGLIKNYVCTICGYVYDPSEGDPDNGVAPGTDFKDIPNEWVCPVCGAAKDLFEEEK